MAWDPTQPVTNSPLLSAPVRANFQALNTAVMAALTGLANGQVLVKGAGPVVAGVPPGTNGQVLTLTAGAAGWATPTGGGGGGQSDLEILNVKDYGAVCDDVTDDTAAIQAAIDAAGSAISVEYGIRRSGLVVLIPGPCVISDTLLIQRKSITLTGRGWGYRLGPVDPHASYLRWNGPAGIPMIQLQDTFGGAVIRDLHLIGKTTARPSCGISFYETDDGVPNFHNMVENVHIGPSSGETDEGTQFTDGIRFEGPYLGNNDSHLLRNIFIARVTECGIRTASTQQMTIVIEGLSVLHATYGIRNVGEIVGTGLRFYNCTGAALYCPEQDDFSGYAFAQWHLLEFVAESCARMIESPGASQVSIRGGYFQIGTFLHADGQVIKMDNLWTHVLTLDGFRFTQAAAPTTAPYLAIKAGVGGAATKHIVLRQIDGWTNFMTGGPAGNGLDVALQSTTDQRYVSFHEASWPPTLNRVAENHLTGTTGLQADLNRKDIWQSLAFNAASPAQLTADVNNYAPSTATFWRLSADAPRTITGLAGGVDGRVLWILNIGPHPITFGFENGLSLAANRIWPTTFAAYILPVNGVVQLLYEVPVMRWRLVVTDVGFANPMSSLGDVILGGVSGLPGRLGIGSTNQVLTVVGGSPTWATLPVDPGFANPMSASGDIIVGAASGVPARLAKGTDGQVLKLASGTPAWAADTGFANPMTTVGDVIIGGASGAPTRLAAGTNTHVLTLASGTPSWAAPAAPAYPLLAPDGTQAAPSFSFTGATGTGFARNANAANELDLCVGGVTQAYFASGYWVSFGPMGLGGADVWLNRDAAGVLGLRNWLSPATAQTLRLYNTGDPTNGEWLEESWAGNVATLQPAKVGTGTVRALRIVHGPAVAITYSASMTPNAALGNYHLIVATNSTAFTINAPTNPVDGQPLVITIRNTSGGALGTATWNAVFKMAAWTNPATATSRAISFWYNGTNWVETTRTPADVPN